MEYKALREADFLKLVEDATYYKKVVETTRQAELTHKKRLLDKRKTI